VIASRDSRAKAVSGRGGFLLPILAGRSEATYPPLLISKILLSLMLFGRTRSGLRTAAAARRSLRAKGRVRSLCIRHYPCSLHYGGIAVARCERSPAVITRDRGTQKIGTVFPAAASFNETSGPCCVLVIIRTRTFAPGRGTTRSIMYATIPHTIIAQAARAVRLNGRSTPNARRHETSTLLPVSK